MLQHIPSYRLLLGSHDPDVIVESRQQDFGKFRCLKKFGKQHKGQVQKVTFCVLTVEWTRQQVGQ